MQKLQLLRGLSTSPNRPTSLPYGMPLVFVDTNELYIGMGDGVALKKISGNADLLSGQSLEYFQKAITVGATKPVNPALYDLHIDDSDAVRSLSIFDGQNWIEIGRTDATHVDFSTTGDLTATNVQDALLEVYNKLNSKKADRTELTAETERAQKSEANLQSEIDSANAAITQEITDRTQAISDLNNTINNNISSALNAEVKRATDADNALQTELTAETTAREQLDNQLTDLISETESQLKSQIANTRLQDLANAKGLYNELGLKLDENGNVVSFLVDITSDTDNEVDTEGTVFSTYSDNKHEAVSAFQHNTLDFYGTSQLSTIGYVFNDNIARTAYGYAITAPNDDTYQIPKTFVLEGAIGQNGEYVTLDTQTDLVLGKGERKQVLFSVPVNYSSFRIRILELNGLESGFEQIEILGDGLDYLVKVKVTQNEIDAAVANIQTQLDELTDQKAAKVDLDAAIAQLNATVKAEVIRATGVENNLQSQINSLQSTKADQSAVDTKNSSQDAAINNLSQVKADKSYVDTQDSSLSAAITNLSQKKADQSTLDADVASLQANQQAGDTQLQKNIDALTNQESLDIQNVNSSIENEVSDRKAADASLQTEIDQINNVKSDKTYVDGQIANVNSQIADLTSKKADQTYVDQKDAANSAASQAADAQLQANINTETQARLSKDSDLQSQLDSLKTNTTSDSQTNLQAAKDYTDQKISALIDAAPDTLDTLNKIATELKSDENIANALTNTVAQNLTDSKTYTDQQVSTEATARDVSDKAIQANLDTEIAARNTAISGEAGTRSFADTQLQANIDAETKARQDADNALTQAYTQADADLKSYVDTQNATIRSDFNTVDTSIRAEFAAADTAEATARENADQALQTQLDQHKSRLDGHDAEIAKEISDRQAADTLETQARTNADNTITSSLNSEIARAKTSEANLQSEIDNINTTIANLDQGKTADISALTARVTALETDIDCGEF